MYGLQWYFKPFNQPVKPAGGQVQHVSWMQSKRAHILHLLRLKNGREMVVDGIKRHVPADQVLSNKGMLIHYHPVEALFKCKLWNTTMLR